MFRGDKRQTQLKCVYSLDSFVHINHMRYNSSAQKVIIIVIVYENVQIVVFWDVTLCSLVGTTDLTCRMCFNTFTAKVDLS
jgi:hypothetical protein